MSPQIPKLLPDEQRFSVVRIWANWDAARSEVILSDLSEDVAKAFAKAKFEAQAFPWSGYLAVPVGSEPLPYRSLGDSGTRDDPSRSSLLRGI